MAGWTLVPEPPKTPKANPASAWTLVDQGTQDAMNRPGVPAPPLPAGLQGAPSGFLKAENRIAAPLANYGIGVGKGIYSRGVQLDSLINSVPLVGPLLESNQALAKEKTLAVPHGTAQNAGFGTERAGEFLVPGLGEERVGLAAAEYAPKFAPLARIGYNALATGAINKSQGGGFGTGALMGLGAGVLGEGLKAAAPSIAETALHVGKRLRLPDRAVGRAIVNETHGITPEAVANSAADQIKARSKSSMNLVGRNTPFKMGRLPQRAQGLVNRVARKNANAINPGRELTDLFKTDPVTGNPIPSEMPFHQALDLRSRVGNFAPSTFSPDSNAAIKPAAKGVYGMTTGAIQRQFPQIKENDAVIHALIPAQGAAQSTANNAGLFQRGMGRIAAHSGALASGIGAGILGYDQTHSLPDAIGAGIFGVGVPEAIASPTFQMMLARSAASRVPAAGLRTMFGGGMSTARQGRQR